MSVGLTLLQSPQSFVVREECRKAAWQNGYRRQLEPHDGWAAFGSTTAKGDIFLAAASDTGPWYLALDHAGVIAELGLAPAEISGLGRARFAFPTLRELYAVLSRVYALAVSLPDGPLHAFIEKTQDLPRATEAERLVVQRVGQEIFRDRLMAYWGGCCPLTGITDHHLLRASHIKPWAKCETDAERLDVHNGLLLSALWDAAFDTGLVTFEDDGSPRLHSSLSPEARDALRWNSPIPLTDQHRTQLTWHRQHEFKQGRGIALAEPC